MTTTEPTNKQRSARIAAILPTYVFRRSRPLPDGMAAPEADCATCEEIIDLISDCLHFAASKGWEPSEVLSSAALNYAEEAQEEA